MHFSTRKQILELALLDLRDSGYLFQGKDFYSEQEKNVLKEFLKNKWKWTKEQVIKAIKKWREEKYLELEGEILKFHIFPTPQKRKDFVIVSID